MPSTRSISQAFILVSALLALLLHARHAWAHTIGFQTLPPGSTSLSTSGMDWVLGAGVDSSKAQYVLGCSMEGYLGLVKFASNGTAEWTVSIDWRTGAFSFVDRCAVFVDRSDIIHVWNSAGYNYLYKYTSSGALLSSTTVSGDGYGRALAVDASNNVYLGGYTNSALYATNAGSTDAFFARYDSGGTRTLGVQEGSASGDSFTGIAVDSTLNIYVTGTTHGSLFDTSSGSTDFVVAKYDSSGTRQWGIQQGSTGTEIGGGIALDSSSNVYVVGSTQGSLYATSVTTSTQNEITLAKFNSDGVRQWGIQEGVSSGSSTARSVALDSLDNVYVAGTSFGSLYGSNKGQTDMVFAKFKSADGSRLWGVQEGSAKSDSSESSAVYSFVAVHSPLEIYVAGITYGEIYEAGNTGDLGYLFVAYFGTCSEGSHEVRTASGISSEGACVACSAGLYSSSNEYALECTQCPAGEYSASSGSSSCSTCPSGSYSLAGAASCTSCTGNTIASTSGQGSCSTCTTPGITANSAHTMCDQSCPVGHYCNGQSTEISACAAGTFTVTTGAVSQADCDQCALSHACPGTGYCKEGYAGRLCSTCASGWYRLQGDCIECPRYTVALYSLLASVMFLVLVGSYIYAGREGTVVGVSIRLTIMYGQLCSIVMLFKVDWPIAVEWLRPVLNLSFSVDFSAATSSPECDIEGLTWIHQWVMYMVLPVAVALAFAGFSVVRIAAICLRSVFNKSSLVRYQRVNLRVMKGNIVRLILRSIGSYGNVVLILYIMLSVKILEYFACVKTATGTYVLVASQDIDCFAGKWLYILPFALMCFVIYVIGVPSVILLVVWIQSQNRTGEQNLLALGWIYSSYSGRLRAISFPQYWRHSKTLCRPMTWRPGLYWEVALIVHRLALCSVVVFFFEHGILQLCLGLILAIWGLALVVYVRPFKCWECPTYGDGQCEGRHGLFNGMNGLLFSLYLVHAVHLAVAIFLNVLPSVPAGIELLAGLFLLLALSTFPIWLIWTSYKQFTLAYVTKSVEFHSGVVSKDDSAIVVASTRVMMRYDLKLPTRFYTTVTGLPLSIRCECLTKGPSPFDSSLKKEFIWVGCNQEIRVKCSRTLCDVTPPIPRPESTHGYQIVWMHVFMIPAKTQASRLRIVAAVDSVPARLMFLDYDCGRGTHCTEYASIDARQDAPRRKRCTSTKESTENESGSESSLYQLVDMDRPPQKITQYSRIREAILDMEAVTVVHDALPFDDPAENDFMEPKNTQRPQWITLEIFDGLIHSGCLAANQKHACFVGTKADKTTLDFIRVDISAESLDHTRDIVEGLRNSALGQSTSDVSETGQRHIIEGAPEPPGIMKRLFSSRTTKPLRRVLALEEEQYSVSPPPRWENDEGCSVDDFDSYFACTICRRPAGRPQSSTRIITNASMVCADDILYIAVSWSSKLSEVFSFKVGAGLLPPDRVHLWNGTGSIVSLTYVSSLDRIVCCMGDELLLLNVAPSKSTEGKPSVTNKRLKLPPSSETPTIHTIVDSRAFGVGIGPSPLGHLKIIGWNFINSKSSKTNIDPSCAEDIVFLPSSDLDARDLLKLTPKDPHGYELYAPNAFIYRIRHRVYKDYFSQLRMTTMIVLNNQGRMIIADRQVLWMWEFDSGDNFVCQDFIRLPFSDSVSIAEIVQLPGSRHVAVVTTDAVRNGFGVIVIALEKNCGKISLKVCSQRVQFFPSPDSIDMGSVTCACAPSCLEPCIFVGTSQGAVFRANLGVGGGTLSYVQLESKILAIHLPLGSSELYVMCSDTVHVYPNSLSGDARNSVTTLKGSDLVKPKTHNGIVDFLNSYGGGTRASCEYVAITHCPLCLQVPALLVRLQKGAELEYWVLAVSLTTKQVVRADFIGTGQLDGSGILFKYDEQGASILIGPWREQDSPSEEPRAVIKRIHLGDKPGNVANLCLPKGYDSSGSQLGILSTHRDQPWSGLIVAIATSRCEVTLKPFGKGRWMSRSLNWVMSMNRPRRIPDAVWKYFARSHSRALHWWCRDDYTTYNVLSGGGSVSKSRMQGYNLNNFFKRVIDRKVPINYYEQSEIEVPASIAKKASQTQDRTMTKSSCEQSMASSNDSLVWDMVKNHIIWMERLRLSDDIPLNTAMKSSLAGGRVVGKVLRIVVPLHVLSLRAPGMETCSLSMKHTLVNTGRGPAEWALLKDVEPRVLSLDWKLLANNAVEYYALELGWSDSFPANPPFSELLVGFNIERSPGTVIRRAADSVNTMWMMFTTG